MKSISLRCACFSLLTFLATGAGAQEARWYRGNTHTHTNWAAPDVVARWYREHKYQFVVFTDLNYWTPVDGLKAVFDAPGRFLVLPGTELSVELGPKIVDVNGLGVTHAVEPALTAGSVTAVLDRSLAGIRKAAGVPVVAHPNLTWAITAPDLLATDAAAGPLLFEVWNPEPGMNNLGGGGQPSTEELWDQVLSTGRRMFGVAADDAHHFYGEFDRDHANPGRAWIMVRASELTGPALLAAIARGDFYASTGVELLRCEADDEGISLALSDATRDLGWSQPGANPTRYRTFFIGRDGEVLATDTSLTPSYRFRGDELYVRARVESSDGGVAWTQPVFRSPSTPPQREDTVP
jgi:hypothetical protein